MKKKKVNSLTICWISPGHHKKKFITGNQPLPVTLGLGVHGLVPCISASVVFDNTERKDTPFLTARAITRQQAITYAQHRSFASVVPL